MHREAVECIPRHTTSMVTFSVYSGSASTKSSRSNLDTSVVHFVSGNVTVVHEECNGCSSEGFCRASAVEECVGCCALARNLCKPIALCQVSEVQHTGLEQA